MENLNNNNTENTQGQSTNSTETENTPKTYTEEEVQALLQKEGDRRISQYMKTVEKKQKEAEKLSKMNDTEKYEYQLQLREAEIEKKEQELALAENKTVASKILVEKGLSLELVDFVIAQDAETMDSNIKKLDKAFKASVKAEVEKRLGQKVPTKNLTAPETITRDKFIKMSISERQALATTDPELYKSLSKH